MIGLFGDPYIFSTACRPSNSPTLTSAISAVISPTANMFEVYITDPDEVPNPANYVTEIYIPVIVTETEQ